MNPKFLIPLILFLAMAVLLGVGLTLNPRELPSTMINKPAPHFSLKLLYTPDESFSPSDYKGQR